MIKLVVNIVVNIILLTLYVLLFGQESISKYLEKGIIIVTHEEIPSFISPPGDFVFIHKLRIYTYHKIYSYHNFPKESND